MWLFFDQAFLLDPEQALSTFLLDGKVAGNVMGQPVDKSVVKLWKDSAEGRSYWLGAIVGLPITSCKMPWATQLVPEGQAKNFVIYPQSLVDSGLQLFHLPPETVDRPVDKVRVHGCKPRCLWLWKDWLFFVQFLRRLPLWARPGMLPADFLFQWLSISRSKENTMSNTLFITGATSGFGEACARRFAEAGWKLVLTGRREERLNALCAELSKQTEVHGLVLDVRDRKAMEEAIANLPPSFAKLRGLINNAGLALGVDPAPKCDLDDWDTMVDTNIKGLMYATRLLLPRLIAHGRGAGIVNLGSVAGNYPYPGSHVYGGTKAFVGQFSLNLRCDLQGTGVRVSNIEPGLCESEFSLVRFAGDQERYNATYAGAEPIQPQDIADTIFWVLNAPAHININSLELMPVSQTWAGFAIERNAKG